MEGRPLKSSRCVRAADDGRASDFFGKTALVRAWCAVCTRVRMRYCSFIATVLSWCCSLGYPLYIPCTSLVHPLCSRGDFRQPTDVSAEPRPGFGNIVWADIQAIIASQGTLDFGSAPAPRTRKLIRWAQGYKAATGSSWYFEWTPLVFWALFYLGLVMPKKPITTAQNTKTGVLANAIVPALIHAQHQIVM